jgi:carbamoyltransferase
VNSGEYKLMGLAPYGEPRHVDLILEKLVDLKDDGSFRLDLSCFNYCQGLTMTSPKFHTLFGGPPRRPESQLTQREMDIAASIQVVTEEIVMRMARHVHEETGKKNLCLAGGVALNCVANGRILREGPFERIWIQPAAGDAGGALGVALFIWHQLLEKPRSASPTDAQKGSLLGPGFGASEVHAFLDGVGAQYTECEEDELLDRVAGLLADRNVVGWMQGRMEYGPRALGCRSILGDARSSDLQSVMNLKIKFRESFRPFAPSALQEEASDYFGLRPDQDSPYMLLVAGVAEPHLRKLSDEEAGRSGLEKLKVERADIPAVTHVDCSARLQTVDAERHGRYHKLIRRFADRTGCPVVINTSFNIRGEPIVCTPEDAYRCFMATNMDALVIENALLLKNEQKDAVKHEVDAYIAQFQLD